MTSPFTGLHWTTDNKKMVELEAIGFPLPAGDTCPGAGSCKENCYATQGRYVMDNVAAPRAMNLVIVLKLLRRGPVNLATMLKKDLDLVTQDVVRIHDSGDFFNQDYLDAWILAISWTPEKKFYCYTKSHHLDWSKTPRNLAVIHSLGSKFDDLVDCSRPHARVFRDLAELLGYGYTDGSGSDRVALVGTIKVGLIYHGTRRAADNGFLA
jgi:hypothetical protein